MTRKRLVLGIGTVALLAAVVVVYIWIKWIPRRDVNITGSLSDRVALYVFGKAKPDMDEEEVESIFGPTGRITIKEDDDESSATLEYGVHGGILKFHFSLGESRGGAVEFSPNYLGVESFFKGKLPCELPADREGTGETCIISIYRNEKLLMQVRCMGRRVNRIIYFNE